MKHPGHSQTACVHSKHIGIGNEDTGNDHGAGKTKYNKSVPFLALKTNMLFDIALIPNIEVEVPVGKCWSLNGELMFPWWLFDNDKYCMQILSGGLETRYWLDNKKKRNILTGHFAGLVCRRRKVRFAMEREWLSRRILHCRRNQLRICKTHFPKSAFGIQPRNRSAENLLQTLPRQR